MSLRQLIRKINGITLEIVEKTGVYFFSIFQRDLLVWVKSSKGGDGREGGKEKGRREDDE